MRTVHFRSFAIAVLAFGTLTTTAGAQDRAAGLLNVLEVRALVARAEPADHARLAVHFTALADRYAADAKDHLSMSQGFTGNPRRTLGAGMSAHCTKLAELNTQSATTLRELASYHEKLAAGAAATPPRGGARFHAGAGAAEPTAADLSALAARASTPAEHRAIEEYFLTLAKRYTADAAEHAALAQASRGTRIAHAAVQHDRLARLSRDAAKEARAAAAMHKQLANIGR